MRTRLYQKILFCDLSTWSVRCNRKFVQLFKETGFFYKSMPTFAFLASTSILYSYPLKEFLVCVKNNCIYVCSLNIISRWCFTTGLTFNTDKTFSMHICRKYGCLRMSHGFVMNGLPIRCVENCKFLGVTIDNKLNWNNHIMQLKNACRKSLNILKHLSHKQCCADRTSLMRYRMLIKPKLDCGVKVYSSASPSLLEKLNLIYNAAIRIATGAFRSSHVLSLYAESGMKPPSTFRDIKVMNTYLQMLGSPTNPMHEKALIITEQEQDNVRHNKCFLYRMHHLSTQMETPM